MMLEYVDSIAKLEEEVGSYFEDHFSGCEEYRASWQSVCVDKTLTQTLMDLGNYNWYLIKDEGKLVGYLNVSINTSPITSKIQAVVDYIYIIPEYRDKGYTKNCISELETVLIKEDIKDLSILLPNKEYSDKVAKGLGYHKTSAIYTKYLGEI